MVFRTHSGRHAGSHRVAKDAGPTALAGGAISSCSPERGDPASGEWATGLLWAAAAALLTNAGSSRAGPRGEPCVPVPWFAWLPTGSERSGEKDREGGWASRGPTRPWNSRLGNENSLLRRRGLLPPYQRFPKFSEPSADEASTLLRGLCSVRTCSLLGSVCLEHALLSASAGWAEPIPGGALPAQKDAPRTAPPWRFM